LNGLAVAAQLKGDYSEARRLMEQAIALARTADQPFLVASVVGNLGVLERLDRRFTRSRELLEESLATFRASGAAEHVVPEILFNYADTLIAQESFGEASEAIREGLELVDEINHSGWLPQALVVVASLATATGRAQNAATLLGAAHKLEETIDTHTLDPEQGSVYQPTLERARDILGADGFGAAYDRGASLTADEALQLARSTLD
jgi:ATP/maltotriose-dependent transcriptional regulator MalT